ncbi:MAG: DUF2807 domain-containing protein [Bacteroidales bacterium]|nr:DUF2807 domain-containing protein [Bacteroidales bacterium]
MKNLFNIALKAAITLAAFAGLQFVASAQISQKETSQDQPEFTAINIANDFDVTLVQGEPEKYNITLTVDEPLSPYLSVRVQGKTLFVSYEEKSVPKEVKKLYSGRNAPKPVFHAVITLPVLEGITIGNNVVLNSAAAFEGSEKFELNAMDDAQVKLLTVSARQAKIVLQKKANAVLNINTENALEVITEGDSSVGLKSTAGELVINASGKSKVSATNMSSKVNVAMAGSAQVSVSGPCATAIVNAEGNSKLTLSGAGESISVKSAGKANIDAYGLEVTTASVDMAGSSQLSVNASESIELNLAGGSKLLFGGAPIFKIVKIAKSSVTPYGAGE